MGGCLDSGQPVEEVGGDGPGAAREGPGAHVPLAGDSADGRDLCVCACACACACAWVGGCMRAGGRVRASTRARARAGA